MKILLAIDGSPCSNAAVREVGRRPWPLQSEVRIIIVDPPIDSTTLWGGASPAYDELVQRQRTEAIRHLNAAEATLKQLASGLHVTSILREGYPKEMILEEAERWGAELIVIGSHGHGAIRRFFLGSVSLAVATNAPCSVEIVRGPQGAAEDVLST